MSTFENQGVALDTHHVPQFPVINLLSSQAVTSNNETLPFRSTTYEGKYNEPIPFQKGSVYIQDPNDSDGSFHNSTIDAITVTQLYTLCYRSFMSKQRRREELNSTLPPAPPDFDGDAPTNPECVAQYVKGMATAYNSIQDNPTPFQLLQHLLMELSSKITLLSSNQNANEHRTNQPVVHQTDLQSPLEVEEEDTFYSSAPVSLSPQEESDAFTLSLSLARLNDIQEKTVLLFIRKIQTSPKIPLAIATDVMEAALTSCREALRDDHKMISYRTKLCSLLGLLVCLRRRISEVLDYLSILEEWDAESQTNIVPSKFPFSDAILRNFSFCDQSMYPVTSPVDCYQGEPQKMFVDLWEGASVNCIAVSPNGRFLAAATTTGLSVFDFANGSLFANLSAPEVGKECHVLVFSKDSTQIICSDFSGLKHYVFNTTLDHREEKTMTEPSIPVDYHEGRLTTRGTPFLSCGSNRSLYLLGASKSKDALNISLEESLTGPTDALTICSHLGDDFSGTLIKIEMDNAESFSVEVNHDIVNLKQGNSSCTGVFPSISPWMFFLIKWNRGVWSLSINSQIVELQGSRDGQMKSIRIKSVTACDGTGHISSLTAWVGQYESNAVHSYNTEKRIETCVKALFNLPMDEGEGLWLKETVSMSCLSLTETKFVWDSRRPAPALPKEENNTVRLNSKLLIESRVLSSQYRTLLILPSTYKGADDFVIEVSNKTNRIRRVYRCPRNCSENLYCLLNDEAEMIVYQQRFSTFSLVKLSNPTCLEERLLRSGLSEHLAQHGTSEWLLEEMYKKIYIECNELQRAPPENSVLSMANLKKLSASLRKIQPTTNKLKVLAILSLTLIHFKQLISVDEKISSIASSLKESSKNILKNFKEDIIVNAASALFSSGASKSLTLDDKASIFLHADNVEYAEMLRSNLTKESIFSVVNHLITKNGEQAVEMFGSLLAKCRMEEKQLPENRPVTQFMQWFVLSAITSLKSKHDLDSIANIMKLFCTEARVALKSTQWGRASQNTFLHTGFIPLLIVVSESCPECINLELEQELLSILATAPHLEPREVEKVTFSTREACDVYPTSREAHRVWRYAMDFSKSKGIAITKESSSPEFRVILVNTDEPVSSIAVVNNQNPFVKFNGGTIILSGGGENTFTIIAQYEFDVDVSWATILCDSIRHLLISEASHLTEKPKVPEVFMAPLVRHGLESSTLAKHKLDLPGRVSESHFAHDILNDLGTGKEFVDQVCKGMRGSITPSMRPAIQALLSILIHNGMTSQQAEDELKLRWFSGEWGSKLQGPGRDRSRQALVNLATWIVSSVYHQPDSPMPIAKCISTERRLDCSLGASKSISERRASNSSRRTTIKGSPQSDTLDQVRALLSKEITPQQLELVLVERTRTSLQIERALSLLLSVLGSPQKMPTERTVTRVLEVLWRFSGETTGVHFIESLAGAGIDLEIRVRRAFHKILEHCELLLLGNCPKEIPPQTVLTAPANNGKSTLLLLAMLCHPWDAIDCELFDRPLEDSSGLLHNLEDQMKIPACNLTITSPWRLRRSSGDTTITPAEESTMKAELLGAADFTSLSRIFPNNFSIVIPQLQTSRSEEGIAIEKNGSSSVILRADEGWPITWRDGVPRVFYYEVKITSSITKVGVALSFPKANNGKKEQELPFFYESSGTTQDVIFPTYGEGDTVGCGIVTTTQRAFFTLNGKFISYVGTIKEGHEIVFPTLCIDEQPDVKMLVNFGTAAFQYDFRQLHPSLSLSRGPTWYRVASTAEIVLHYITIRACAVQESKKQSSKNFLAHCCDVLCRSVGKVTSSLMNIRVGFNKDDAGARIKQEVIFKVAEYSVIKLIATLRHVVRSTEGSGTLPDSISSSLFENVSALMLLPFHSIQIATISLLPEVIPHVKAVPDSNASVTLVKTLFEHANELPSADDTLPFVPSWCECDSRNMSIVNVQHAQMNPESQRSIVLGNVLPRTGRVSFSVTIARRSMAKGHSLKGGYFIGVSIAGLTPLSPNSNSQSWKAVKPPIVWAIHDTSPQLPHATNPTVKPNNFQRTFGSGDEIRVVIDRDKQSIDFYRDGEFLKTLFSEVPANIDLVPFAQLYNEDSSATFGVGEMTAPISAPTLLSAASVDVLRSMLTLQPFQKPVSERLCSELDAEPNPRVTLAIFNSIPDPRILQLHSSSEEHLYVSISRVCDMRCKFSIGDVANYEHIYNLRSPANPTITCSFDVRQGISSLDGISKCIGKLIAATRRLIAPLISTQALCNMEVQGRRKVIEEEKDHRDHLLQGIRGGNFCTVQKLSQTKQLQTAPRVPMDYTFSSVVSHPGFVFPRWYCGRLCTVPNGAANAIIPFTAVAEPAVPTKGTFSIRCQFIRGHNTQILGGGYYFGVCTSSFNWKKKDLNSGTPEVWAMHDMDETPWRLRHMHVAARFPIAAEPSCVIVSGDVIRLEINRDDGTMHAYRKPVLSEEISLGLIFDNLPIGENLYPFVHLYNTDAVAVLLPSDSTKPAIRFTNQQAHFALCTPNEKRNCDGCASQHQETKLTDCWFKCNECADYALCKNCFYLCIHSHHAFTEMNGNPLVHSDFPPVSFHPGMDLVIPNTSCMYIRSCGCKMSEDKIYCVAESKEDNAFAVWGLVFKGKGLFTVTIDTLNGEPLSVDCPTFVGLGDPEEVTRFTPDNVKNSCFSSSSLVTFCSDATLRRPLECTSLRPYGFQKGSTISIEVDTTKRTATILRDWIVMGTKPISFSNKAANSAFPICCFVFFGKRNMRATVAPEEGLTTLVKLGEVRDYTATVYTKDKKCRLVTREMCRLPLKPCTVEPKIGQLGYTFVDKVLTQCRVFLVEKDETVLFFPQENRMRRMPISHFLIDAADVISEERLINKEAGESGATLEQGFVMSRLLLILSCFCENDILSTLVTPYSNELMSVLKSLASVKIGNESPLDFLGEIRRSIAVTANCMRTTSSNCLLSGFVPTFGMDERKRKFKKPGMLVRCVDKQSDIEPIYRVVSRKAIMLTLEDIVDGKRIEKSIRHCIPVKQCAGKPWYTLPNGLPCSLLEHTLRIMNEEEQSKNLPLVGDWQGEVSIGKSTAANLEVHLTEGGTGTAEIAAPTISHYIVFYTHQRYERTVEFFLISKVDTDERLISQMCTTTNFSERRTILDAAKDSELCERLNYFYCKGELDSEGLRITGTLKPKEGKSGRFSLNSTLRVNFAPLITETARIEPLPDCLDIQIPSPMPRETATIMHRLVVLLARHLYLVLCNKCNFVTKEFSESIFLFNYHPLCDRLLSTLVGQAPLYHMAYEAQQLILDSTVKPWDSASLSVLLTKSLLLRPEMMQNTPDSVLWDSVHAVVAAAHRCGTEYRHQLLRKLTSYVERNRHRSADVYAQLFGALFSWIDRNISTSQDFSDSRKDIAAGVDLVLTAPESLQKIVTNISLLPLHCLIDLARSLANGSSLPRTVETVRRDSSVSGDPVDAICSFGDCLDGELKVGKVMSSCTVPMSGKFYYEVVLPDRLASPFFVGWGTQLHCDVPSQHVGSDRNSFAFNGSDVASRDSKEEYKIPQDLSPNCVIGCLLDMTEKLVAWSVDGTLGPFITIPIALPAPNKKGSFYAFASTGSCSGMRIQFKAQNFEYVPDGYTDLSGRYTRALISEYDRTQRSSLPAQSISFYSQLSCYLSDLEENKGKKERPNRSSSLSFSTDGDLTSMRKYPLICGISSDLLNQYSDVIAVVESCMATAGRFVDLDGDLVEGALSNAFLYLKLLVRRSFRQKILYSIPPVEKVANPNVISIRASELYSSLSRTPEVALQHSILSQLYKQIGSYTQKQLGQSPLFKVHLYISGSSHAPIDMGGPYRQLWTVLAEEIMRHPDKCFPHSDFHRNPLFRFVNNSKRVSLVPDSQANSSFELSLFNFFGKLLGHAARAKFPFDFDFSPFMWKFLVDDSLSIRDYYQFVDSVVEKSMEDDNFLLSTVAEEIIPDFAEKLLLIDEDELNASQMVKKRLALAENCLVHSMDLQLSAMRNGLWSVLPRRVVRCLSWKDLETLVCGDPDPSLEELKKYIKVQLQGPREQYFWKILEEMTGEQRAALLCFASGQKRLPLVVPITINENKESVEHLPRAQSCSSLITIPCYSSYDMFKEKLLLALDHQIEMELA